MADVSNRAEEIPWSGIRKMFNLAAQVPEAVNLSVGQPDFDTPEHMVEVAKRALDEGQTQYTAGLGILSLREAISRKVRRENTIRADPDKEIIVTVGAMEGIILALLAIVDPGDEVIIGDPTYTNYPGQIQLASGRPVSVPAPENNDFKMDPADIERAITKKTKLLFINSPANPTGAVLLRSDLEAIAEIAQRHDLFVLSDEEYERLIYDGVEHISIASLPGMKERTTSVFTFSKTYAMTGWRMGYVVGPERVIDQMHKMQEDLASCVPGFIQQAGIAALDGPQDCVDEMLAEYDRRRRFIVRALNEVDGVTCLRPKGALYAFPNVSSFGRTSEEVAIFLLRDCKVVCVPGTAFGPRGEGYLRISYASSMEQLKEGMERIKEGVKRL
jgi:aspartate/methionine/tyrosine aminotransferase